MKSSMMQLDASEDKDYTDDAIVSIAENSRFLPASQSARWEDIGRKKYKKLVSSSLRCI